MAIDFTGQAGIVTGAGRGLGRAFALDLAQRGAAVIANGRPPEAGGGGEVDAVVEDIRRAGGRALAVHVAVGSPEAAETLIEACFNAFGSVDFLINNAGVLKNGAFEGMPPADFDTVLDVHLAGSFFLGQRAFTAMVTAGGGRIVNVSSTTALVAMPGLANYAAAKGGVIALTRAMAAEGADKGIKVNALVPSALGQMQANNPIPGFAERFGSLRETLRPRMAPETVAPLATFLASRSCGRSGEIWTACAGRFARVATFFSHGWVAADADAVTAEDIAAHIDQIANVDGRFEPTTLDDIYRDIIDRLPRS